MLQTEGHVGASESMCTIGQECAPVTTPKTTADCLESSTENGESQVSMDAVGESNSCEYAQPETERPISPVFSGGIYASIHAPHRRSTGVHQTLDDNTEELATPAPTTRSSLADNGPPRGLAGSIHAPGARTPDQATQHSLKHSADAPNWAAAARAQVSTASEGGVPAQCNTSFSPSPDVDVSGLPTTMRCAAAAKDQEESFVDNSDGSSDHADDPEGTTGSDETDTGLNEVHGPNEQDTDARIPRTRRRGKPRRPRQKAPYILPPRMQVLTQHLIVDARAAQAHATKALVPAPAPLSGHQYNPIHPPPPHHSASAPGHMVPRNVILNHLRQPPHYRHPWHLGSLHMGTHYPSPFPGFNPIYPHMPHPQNLSLQAPFTPLYGR
jgi:hypothetical protein